MRIGRYLPIAVFAGLGAVLWQFTIDDNFISYRYAKHLANGYGLVWNLGEAPVEGFSNLLWVLVLAGVGRFGIDIPLAAKILSFIVGGTVIAILPAFIRRLTGSPDYDWAPSLLLSLSVPWLLWSVAGGEVTLFSLFFLLVVWGLLESEEQSLKLSIGCVGMILTRPDGTLYAGAALLASLIHHRSWSEWMRRSFTPLLMSVATVAAVVAFRLWYFGDWVPNTLRAKVVSSFPGLALVGLWVLLALPFLALLVWMYRTRQRRMFVLALALVLAANALAVARTSIVMNLIQRYHTFLLPALFAPIPLLLRRIDARRLAAPLLAGAIGWSAIAWPNAYFYARQERFMCAYREGVAQDLANGLPRGSRIALVDVGIIGYRTGLPIVDIWGLCNARIAKRGFSIPTLMQEDFNVCLLSVRATRDSSEAKIMPAFGIDWALSNDSLFNSQYSSVQVLRPDLVGAEPWKFYYAMFGRKDPSPN